MTIRLLYVEDSDADADLTRIALERSTPRVEMSRACSLGEARAMLRERPGGYEVLLLDLNLPDGSGLELLAEVRQTALPVTVVMLTGSGDQTAVISAIKSGADDYLVKHGDYLKRLATRLEEACERTRSSGVMRHRGLRVLYAEHNVFDGDLAVRHLATHAPHIRVEVVNTADAVMRRLADAQDEGSGFDVLLLDYRLPGADGLELARELRHERNCAIPMVLITGHGSEEIAASALRFGIDDYLTKRAGYLFELAPTLEKVHRQAQLAREEMRLREITLRLERLLSASPTLLYTLAVSDDSIAPTWVSSNIERLLGYTETEALAPNWWISHVHPDDRRAAAADMEELFVTGLRIHEYRFAHRDGKMRWVHDEMRLIRDAAGKPVEIVGTWTDISPSKLSEERLAYLSHFDPLTDLPNRNLLNLRLDRAIEQAGRLQARIAVLYIDLDRFKNVNDSLGHPAGDEVLVRIARRLRAELPEEHTLARLGGDEFVVVVEACGHADELVALTRRLIALIEQPIWISSGKDVILSASVGISLYPIDGMTGIELVQHADAALYRAKDKGRNTFQFYHSDLTAAANQRLELELQLRRALERGELVLYYQPMLGFEPQSAVGAEALLRWQPPGAGMIGPDRFIPIAEETGLIVTIGAWVLREACARAKAWLDQGLPFGRIAVNLSVRQFSERNLVEVVAKVLEETGLPPTRLELEITESALMSDVEEAVAKLDALRALGVALAVDDFGTGYSSLAYLKRLPLDKLKIDQSFIRGMGPGSNDEAIVTATIAMAQSLGLKTHAEGVETEQQLGILRELGCNAYQGYIVSRPVPAEEFVALPLFTHRPASAS